MAGVATHPSKTNYLRDRLKWRRNRIKNGPYSDTWSEGALEGIVGSISPLTILGKSWLTWVDPRSCYGSTVEVSL
jgi:hypothetical protein